MTRIWFDITNTPQVHFLSAIYDELNKSEKYEFVFTARDFSETLKLLESKIGLSYQTIGGHYGKSYFTKAMGLIMRFKSVLFSGIEYDVSISCGSENAIWGSWMRRKKSIAFGDNDLARQWTYGHFVDYSFFPDAIPAEILKRQGLNESKLFLYPGYKEDIYLANYKPDLNFLSKLPFKNYVVVRPENIMANYIHNKNVKSITPDLLRKLSELGVNILYLPRYKMDAAYSESLRNIFTPVEPVNGLDACYYSEAVMTGAGTFAREAACLGIPSFSFFAGNDLMKVDQKLISEGKMIFSRDVDELVKGFKKSNKQDAGLKRSKEVKGIVIDKLLEVIKA
jgi:uncharacterized protein